ncbi:MAG TPA: chromosomal replication initiator protein DnaA, partial [Clostridiales bacterium]|nr:chromosomal replication initiator protein DnaA [Clostridiales bacterium]
GPRHYSLSVDDLKSDSRVRRVAFPRQIAMYLCRELTNHSLPKIGEEFGGRDHTTVLHACEKITKERTQNPDLDEQLKNLLSALRELPA